MKILIFCLLIFFSFNSFSQNGIVNIETKYQDVSNPEFSMKYKGQGFIVDYPVKSKVTNKVVNLKLVLTAAHLVFGGIYTDRLDNFRIFEADSSKEIYALGMISDVIHDSAAVILCTKEAMELFEVEYKSYGIELGNMVNISGQSFTSGGGCASTGQGAVIEDVVSFASYKGPELVFDTSLGDTFDHTPISQSALSKAQIVVNDNQGLSFLMAGDSYAIPWIKNDAALTSDVYKIQDLKKMMKSKVSYYNSLSQVPGEYSIPLSLEGGYSGSPIMTYDADSDQLIVEGVYKSSTQSLNSDSYSSLGWATPTEISQGLLNVFLLRYPQELHRWHTIPQVYLYLNNGGLVRELYYSDFILQENESWVSETNPSLDPTVIKPLNLMDLNPDNGSAPEPAIDPTKATGWVRSDTGNELWVRSDSGKTYSSNPKRAKSLMVRYRDNLDAPEQPLMMFVIKNKKSQPYILLPPVMESVVYMSKNTCPSCVNYKVNDLEAVSVLNQQGKNLFIETLLENLEISKFAVPGISSKKTDLAPSSFEFSKYFLNINQKIESEINFNKIQIRYSFKVDRIKVDMLLGEDLITIYILSNNKYLYLSFDGVWVESGYSSVLETKTKLGRYAFLELAGVFYHNLELPNPNSFRLKIEDQDTQLFEIDNMISDKINKKIDGEKP